MLKTYHEYIEAINRGAIKFYAFRGCEKFVHRNYCCHSYLFHDQILFLEVSQIQNRIEDPCRRASALNVIPRNKIKALPSVH